MSAVNKGGASQPAFVGFKTAAFLFEGFHTRTQSCLWVSFYQLSGHRMDILADFHIGDT